MTAVERHRRCLVDLAALEVLEEGSANLNHCLLHRPLLRSAEPLSLDQPICSGQVKARRSCLSVPARPARKLEKATGVASGRGHPRPRGLRPARAEARGARRGRGGARRGRVGRALGQRQGERPRDTLARGRPAGDRPRRPALLGDRPQGRGHRRSRDGGGAARRDRRRRPGPTGTDRVCPRPSGRRSDRRSGRAPRGADPRPGRHERLARLPITGGGQPLGLRPRRDPRRRPLRRPAGDRRSLPADLRPRRPSRLGEAGPGSSASTASGRFTPTRSSPSTRSSRRARRRSSRPGRSSPHCSTRRAAAR